MFNTSDLSFNLRLLFLLQASSEVFKTYLIKSYSRSVEKKIARLSILFIESDLVLALSFEDVALEFASAKTQPANF